MPAGSPIVGSEYTGGVESADREGKTQTVRTTATIRDAVITFMEGDLIRSKTNHCMLGGRADLELAMS